MTRTTINTDAETYTEFAQRIGASSPITKAKAIALDKGIRIGKNGASEMRQALKITTEISAQMHSMEQLISSMEAS